MRVIILAAGIAERLRPLTNNIPKCLLKVGGQTMLYRTVQICAKLGLKDLCVITGHGAEHIDTDIEKIREAEWAKKTNIRCIYNASYDNINNCYSLLLGLPEKNKNETIIIINSDDVFDGRILKMISQEGPTVLVIDNVKNLTKESMKVYVENKDIRRIGKGLDIKISVGEYIGLARIGVKDIESLRKALEDVVSNNPNGFYENAFDLMFDKTKIAPCHTDGLMWTEVDTLEDLAYARKLIEMEMLE